MATVARWCFRHRIIVVIVWVLALAGVAAGERLAGTSYTDNFALPGTDSTRATQLLESAYGGRSGESDQIVWHVDRGSVRDPQIRQRVSTMLAKVAQVPSVARVSSPYPPDGAAQISRDGRTAYAIVTFTGYGTQINQDDVRKVIDLATSARTDRLQVELGGNAIQQVGRTPTSRSELIGVLAAAVVLLIAFGSLLSMLLPLAVAVMSLTTATLAISLLSHLLTIFSLAPTIAALIGLGVGIDYALFIVTRHRNGLKEGLSVQESAVRALNTSGRAVIFAGGTVCIALLGLLVLGVSFLSGIGISAAVMVVFTVLASITLLPALLGFLGPRVLSRRERRELAEHGHHEVHKRGTWARWSAFVARRPAVLMPIALAIMILLTVPFYSMRLGASDEGNDPASSTTRQAYDLIAAGFGPGVNGPLRLVAEIPSTSAARAMDQLTAGLDNVPGVAQVRPLPAPPDAPVRIVEVIPTTAPQSEATSALIDRLRTRVIPSAEAGTPLRVYVGGQTAIFDDFAAVLSGKLPLFVGVIVGLGFLLLLVAFRSIVVPLTAAVMNLLAAGASLGVVVALFQWGWGEPLGLGSPGPIDSFLPVIMLAILFGLSMDYQVFLVSRMHEEWVHGRGNRQAVTIGQASTGRVITAAATIMIFVFLAFVFGGQRIIAEFGIGLTTAVFLDAFVLRTVLVPALMHLFGPANWWLPGWLDRRLPHFAVEPADEATRQPAREPVAADTGR